MGSASVHGPLWGAAAGNWARLVESATTPFYEAVFDAIGAADGTALLDAAAARDMRSPWRLRAVPR